MKYKVQITGTFEIDAGTMTVEEFVAELNNIKLNEFLTVDKVAVDDVEEVE